MTTSKLARYFMLALIGAAMAATGAEARTRHQDNSIPSFDRHAVHNIGGNSVIDIRPARNLRTASGVKQKSRKHVSRPARQRSPGGGEGVHLLVASSGAKTSVSTVAKPHFQCLLTKLESAGYHVDFMGGYARRGNSSAHPTGNALDVNQTSRNVVTRRLPANATEIARDCGLVHGAVWSNPDQGHFEMARKYGYVIHHRRTRYALR